MTRTATLDDEDDDDDDDQASTGSQGAVHADPRPLGSASRRRGWLGFALRAVVVGPVAAALLAHGSSRRAAHALTCDPCRRRARVRVVALVALAVPLLAAGAVRATAQPGELRDCRLTHFTQPLDVRSPGKVDGGVRTAARAALTWLPTGSALAYARARGADLCRDPEQGLIVAHMTHGFARQGTLVGQVYLTYRKDLSYRELGALAEHEGRHTDQWAVVGTLAGPFALPLLYAVDEALFPGTHNHFERLAGLEDGGYDEATTAPTAVARLATACALTALAVAVRLQRRRRSCSAPARPARRRPGATGPTVVHEVPSGRRPAPADTSHARTPVSLRP